MTFDGIGEHGAIAPRGLFPTLAAALDHEWSKGTPEYVLDLCAPPEEAVILVALSVRAGERTRLEDVAIPEDEL